MPLIENFGAAKTATTGKPKGLLKRCFVVALLFTVAALAGVGIYVAHTWSRRNFHVVSEGRVYRSGQMDVAGLTRVIHERGIRTVVNLRGPAEGVKGEWYLAETNASQQLGVEHVDFSLLAGRELKDAEMEDIVTTLERAPKPILIHCKSGSDRTGLVGALYLYSIEGKSAGSAVQELSMLCGHVPYLFWRDTIAMDRSFWRYVSTHKPSVARRLAAHQDYTAVAADSQGD